MLVNQSREVKQLKYERDKLIRKLRYFENEFDKVGSLDAIMSRLGVPSNPDTEHSVSALEELLRQFEGEETTLELFEEGDVEESDKVNETVTGIGSLRNRSGKYRMSSLIKGDEKENDAKSIRMSEADSKRKSPINGQNDIPFISDQNDETEQTELMEAIVDIEETDNKPSKVKSSNKNKVKQNRVQEAIAWAKIRFGDKK